MMRRRMLTAAGRDRIPTDYTARFLFEEPTGSGTLTDETGANDGTYSDMASVAGVVGQGLRFDGASPSRADINAAIGNDPALFALSGWASVDSTTGFLFMLAHRDDTAALIQLSVQDGQLVYQARSSTSGIVTRNAQAVAAGSFFHFVLNWDKTGTTQIWLNNSLAYTDATNFSGNFSSSLSVIGPYSFGTYDYAAAEAGVVDLYTVYSGRNLDPDEIAALYSEGA